MEAELCFDDVNFFRPGIREPWNFSAIDALSRMKTSWGPYFFNSSLSLSKISSTLFKRNISIAGISEVISTYLKILIAERSHMVNVILERFKLVCV